MVYAWRRIRPIWALFPGLLASCAPAPSPKCRPSPSIVRETAAEKGVAHPLQAEHPAFGGEEFNTPFRFVITIKPIAESSTVSVDIWASGAGTSLQAWTIAVPAEKALVSVSAKDMDGAIGTTAELEAAEPPSKSTSLSVQLARPPRGPLRISYTLTGAPRSLLGTPLVEVDPDFFRATGQSLLALPDALADNEIVSVRILIDKSDYNGGVTSAAPFDAATSFGIGAEKQVKTTPERLREAAFYLGRIGTGVFDTYEGRDEAVWFGHTVFDPRPIAADVAGFRTAVGQIFKDAQPLAPATFFIVPDARSIGSFSAHRRAGGVILQVGVGEPWSGAVRIAVATEIVKAYVGERLWIGAPEKPAHSYWFSEGLTRAFARELLFSFGLLTPSELIKEINGLIGTLALSPLKEQSNAVLAEKTGDPGVIPVLVSRGALYATRIDALLKAKPGAKQSLQQILLSLYAQAASTKGPLPLSAWTSAVSAALDAKEGDAFKTIIENGGEITLPANAFGPCFQVGPQKYEPYERGFEVEVTGEEDFVTKVKALKTAGPAEKAGLKVGDIILSEQGSKGNSDVPITLKIRRGNEEKTITYKPAGRSVSAQGVTRKKNVPDEECVP